MESKRTEYVSLNVTPEVKKEIERYADDDKMKEEIIRQYIEREKNWMNDSLKDFDESELLYRCALVKIKDSFKKAQNEYSEAITELYTEAEKQTHDLKNKLSEPRDMLLQMQKELSCFEAEIKGLPSIYTLQSIKDLFSIIKTYNMMSETDKELLIKIINKK